jgi:hypothetical protein
MKSRFQDFDSECQTPKSGFCHSVFLFYSSFIVWILSFVVLLTGCDAFVRKFTRKPKDNPVQEEMVLVPQEYALTQAPAEELYKQYFLFWRSWQDELIEALTQKRSQKKRIDCLNEALKNLEGLKALLDQKMREGLDAHILKLQELKESIVKDPYSDKAFNYAQDAERIKRAIMRDFSYRKIKDYLL